MRFFSAIQFLKKTFSDVYFLIILAISIGLFILNFSNLSLPYFSDELWSYGPAVRKAAVFGPSLSPNSMALEDHWGHPLLFFFISGLWGTVFGASLFSTHLFASLLSVVLLLVIYLTGRSLINNKVAFYTALIFSSQSIFLGQFSLVLPEVMLTIFFFLTLYFAEKEKWGGYLVFASSMVLTKESGVFLVGAIVLWNFLKAVFYKKEKFEFKKEVVKWFILGVPIIALIIHFIILKIQYGWFIMPVRVAEFDFSWSIFQHRLMSTIHYVFIDQGRKVLTISLFFVGILFFDKFSWIKRIMLIIVSFAVMKVFFRYWETLEVVEYTLVPLIVIILFKFLFLDSYKYDKKSGGIIAIFSILTFTYILFISSFFDSRRYLFFLIPIFILTTVYFVSKIKKFNKFLLPLLAVLAITSSFAFQYGDVNSGDDTVHYTNLCEIQKEAVQYLEENYEYNQLIQTSFLFKHSVERPLAGYLSTPSNFTHVKGFENGVMLTKGCVTVVVSNELPDFYFHEKSLKNLTLVKQFEKRNVWIKIYKN